MLIVRTPFRGPTVGETTDPVPVDYPAVEGNEFKIVLTCYDRTMREIITDALVMP